MTAPAIVAAEFGMLTPRTLLRHEEEATALAQEVRISVAAGSAAGAAARTASSDPSTSAELLPAAPVPATSAATDEGAGDAAMLLRAERELRALLRARLELQSEVPRGASSFLRLVEGKEFPRGTMDRDVIPLLHGAIQTFV